MSTAIILCAAFAASLTPSAHHVVVQTADGFQPSYFRVSVGDKITWIWDSGVHSATSGADCSADGEFDAPLDASNTSFTWEVPESARRSTKHFHSTNGCGRGMEGIFLTGAAFNPHDLNGDGFVDGRDVLVIFEEWGMAYMPSDLSMDGVTDSADLGALLNGWADHGR